MKEIISRINELYKKSLERPLTETELEEQKKLRQKYINAFRQNLSQTLDNTYIVDENGNKTKVKKK